MGGQLVRDLSDELIDAMIESAQSAPGPFSIIATILMGGAVSRVSDDETAYSGRQAPFWTGVEGTWEDPSEDEAQLAWCRGFSARSRAFAAAGNYVNGLESADADALRATYGDATYDRLVELKRRYDPTNVFRLNSNIKP